VKADLGDFADLGRVRLGALLHLVRHRLGDGVDDELTGLEDVRTVSFCPCSPSWATMPSSGGVTETMTNWLYGAALTTPDLPIEVTSAMGRGTTDPVRTCSGWPRRSR